MRYKQAFIFPAWIFLIKGCLSFTGLRLQPLWASSLTTFKELHGHKGECSQERVQDSYITLHSSDSLNLSAVPTKIFPCLYLVYFISRLKGKVVSWEYPSLQYFLLASLWWVHLQGKDDAESNSQPFFFYCPGIQRTGDSGTNRQCYHQWKYKRPL